MTTVARAGSETRTHTDNRTVLQTLWIFALLNYLYCDVLSLMQPAKNVELEPAQPSVDCHPESTS